MERVELLLMKREITSCRSELLDKADQMYVLGEHELGHRLVDLSLDFKAALDRLDSYYQPVLN